MNKLHHLILISLSLFMMSVFDHQAHNDVFICGLRIINDIDSHHERGLIQNTLWIAELLK